MRTMKLWLLLFQLISCSAFLLSLVSASTSMRGISPDNLNLYKPNKDGNVLCSDKQIIPLSAVNDDFCDCPDNGFDEPGTSACSTGTFYCQNKGFEPKIIPSAFVDDGVCDCCDGSDEALGVTKCKNTCKEEAYEAQKSTLEEIEVIKKGLAVKKNLIAKAKGIFTEKKNKKESLTKEIAALKEELAKMEKLKAQLKEQVAIRDAEQEDQEKDSEQDKSEEETTEEVSSDSNANQEETAKQENEKEEQEDESFPYPKEYRFKEEKQEKEAATEAGEDDESFPYPEQYRFHEEEQHDSLEEKEDDDEEDDGPVQSDDSGSGAKVDRSLFDTEGTLSKHRSELLKKRMMDSDNKVDDDDDDDDDDNDREPGVFESIISKAWSLFGLVKNQVDDPENLDANLKKVRGQVKKLKNEISSRESQLETIESDLGKDFGVDKEFWFLSEKCVSLNVKQYDYEVCPYKDSKQKEGGSSTSLGNYEGWKEGFKYKTMRFANGQRCWNGPARSAEVKLLCGDKDEIVSADEPSVCAYEMVMKTPVVCSEVDLELLQAKLHKV